MSTLYIALAAIGGGFVYIASVGFAYTVIAKRWSDTEDLQIAAAVWPVVLAAFIAWKLVMIGPAVAKWNEKRKSLPRAVARFEKERS